VCTSADEAKRQKQFVLRKTIHTVHATSHEEVTHEPVRERLHGAASTKLKGVKMATTARYSKVIGSAAESYIISLTWPDGRVEQVGNSGNFHAGMGGDGKNFKAFGEWSPEAKSLLEQANQEREVWSPLPAEVYEEDYNNRSFSNGSHLVRLKCGLEIPMGRAEASARAALGEIVLV
jgi:hypothetical protein